MDAVEQALQNQLANIQTRSGKSLDELYAAIRTSRLTKHGEIRSFLKQELALGHGDANTLTTFYLEAAAAPASAESAAPEDDLARIYSGEKAALLPIHTRLMDEITGFGAFEVSPKKAYVSLRREKQFAMIGPATKTRVDIGINCRDLEPTSRLVKLPDGGMCPFPLSVTSVDEVDAELVDWLKRSFDSAG